MPLCENSWVANIPMHSIWTLCSLVYCVVTQYVRNPNCRMNTEVDSYMQTVRPSVLETPLIVLYFRPNYSVPFHSGVNKCQNGTPLVGLNRNRLCKLFFITYDNPLLPITISYPLLPIEISSSTTGVMAWIGNHIHKNKWFCPLNKYKCLPIWVGYTAIDVTVYPKKYAHGFCFAVLCCGYTLTDFPISIRLISLALWQSNDCPSASKATLMNMDKYFMWIHYERLHNHNKAKHNKTVCIFLGIYCMLGYE